MVLDGKGGTGAVPSLKTDEKPAASLPVYTLAPEIWRNPLARSMIPEDAVREHLLRKLQRYDPEAADRLSEGLDAEYLKRRLRATVYWATGWRKGIRIVAITAGLALMIAPVASETIGTGAALSGTALLLGLIAVGTQWHRKRALYETLAILSDPEYEPEGALR